MMLDGLFELGLSTLRLLRPMDAGCFSNCSLWASRSIWCFCSSIPA